MPLSCRTSPLPSVGELDAYIGVVSPAVGETRRDTYTIPTNLAGHPGMSVPFGTGAEGLPVGVQVLAGTLQEPVMFRAAAALERSLA